MTPENQTISEERPSIPRGTQEANPKTANDISREVARELMSNRPRDMVCWQGSLYKWQAGKYCRIPAKEEEYVISKCFQERDIVANVHAMNELRLNLKTITYIPGETRLNSWLRGADRGRAISMVNGLLYLDCLDDHGARSLSEHTPDYFTLSQLPYVYDFTATCPKWLAFLEQVMLGDRERIQLLKEWAGYLFEPNLNQQRFMLNYGTGANGKSTFMAVLEHLVGLINCSHVPLREFRNPFKFSATLGKLLNTSSETTETIGEQGEAILKACTSGERMMYEHKFHDPVEATPTAKIILSANTLPQFRDRTDGLWRRMTLVPWLLQVPERDRNRNLVKELIEELPGILNWALEGRADLLNRGYFIEPESCQEAARRYRGESSPEEVFLREFYCPSLTASAVKVQDVYAHYTQWCERQGRRPAESSVLGKAVPRVFPKVVRFRSRMKKERPNCYLGLKQANTGY